MKQRHIFVIAAAFIFLIITRFIYPDFVTPSLTHDEMIYAANAQSLLLSGTDFSKKVRLFDLKPIHHMYAEFPASLMVPGFWFIKSPILATHFLPIIFSILLPFIFSWFIFGLFKDKKLSLISLIIFSVNPLLWQMSRLSYDSFFSLFFYILGAAIYINFSYKKSLLSIPIFFLGFFNYAGYKLILFPLTIILYLLKNQVNSLKSIKKKKPHTLIMPIFALLLSLFYGLILLPKQDTSVRVNQTIFTDQERISEITYNRSRLSLNPKLGKFFHNKYLSIFELATNNLVGSLNPTMIFLKGEPSQSGFAVWSHGFLYLIDALLIFFGINTMLNHKNHRPIAIKLLALFFLLLSPAILNSLSEWYLLRNLFAYTILLIFVSYAIFSIKNKPIYWITMFLYTISVLNFAYQYYYQYPLFRSDASEFHERILIEYANKNKGQQIIVYDDEPHYLYLSHLLYTHKLNPKNIDSFQQAFINQEYVIDNVEYASDCKTKEGIVEIYSTLYYPCQNDPPDTQITISSPIDSGGKYKLSNDLLCQDYQLNSYIRIPNLKSIQFQDLPANAFCTRWITKQT